MKLSSLLLIVLFVFTSCKDNKEANAVESIDYSEENLDVTTSVYPEHISKVFKTHGGIDTWKSMKTLKFTIDKESGTEITTTDLNNRFSLIETPAYNIGYDGKDAWLLKKQDDVGNVKPKFYYNLMFYFYAMPFVLADDGINYEDVEPLSFEGQSYPGIKISYESGVGESPDDEYIIYYDSKTGEMAWLAYTVTYFSKEKSKKWSFIQYSDWQKVNGIKLPKRLTWFNVEDGVPTTERKATDFTDIVLTTDLKEASVFAKPDNAEYVTE
ncbi:DUF6503 family protein [Psychroserpens damuponensis]|uniref:DUF6503 family protein n=1 Tax=Psychroserpens damuponensis TaxID=943936 RepID=UPI00058BBD7B|nr:DUF6503 family protein [Psychroserpens damuponensis]